MSKIFLEEDKLNLIKTKFIKAWLKEKYNTILLKLGGRKTNDYTVLLGDRIFYTSTNRTYNRKNGLSDLQPIDTYLLKTYNIKVF